ncbi:MAG: hypothetical protein AAF713_01735 [Pseudomonadota bacterium]
MSPAIGTLARVAREPGPTVCRVWTGNRTDGLFALIDPREAGREEADYHARRALLWRLSVDRGQQGHGNGTPPAVERCRNALGWVCNGVTLAVAQGAGNAQPFYRRQGLAATGRVLSGDALEIVKPLTGSL